MNAFRTYQSLVGKLNYALFLAMLIALPLPRRILQPIAVAWVIAWVLEGRFLQKENWHWDKRALPGLLLVGLTVWEAISLLWCPNVPAGLSMIERHWPFIITVLIPIFGMNEHYRADKLLPALFATCVVSVPLYLFTFFWVWNADAVIWFRHDLIRPFEFPKFHGLTSLIKLRCYYCPTLILSILSTPLLYRQYLRQYPKWEVILTLGIANLVLLSGIIMTGSRTAVLTLVITVAFLMFVMYRKQLKWWWQLLIVAVGLGVALVTVTQNPRFSMLFTTDFHNINLADATEANEPRYYLWATVLEHWKEYGFFGMGAGQHSDFMMERFREAGNELFISLGYGPHNQYFSYRMCLGPLAVLLVLAVFVIIPRVYRGAARYSAHAFAFLYAFLLLSDDLLERMDSIIMLIIWMVLLYVIDTASNALSSPTPPLRSE